jgi:molybdopterin-guanine dinucleotide biosynthesis protein A
VGNPVLDTTPQCTGIILAGGLSSRFSGKNKALADVGGKPIFAYIYDLFNHLFNEIILVTNDPGPYLGWNLTIVTDIYPIRSSMTGVHAGLFYASNPHSFVAACDTPFLKKELVTTLLECVDRKTDLVLPQTSAGFEPLCAVYSKNCLKPIERCLEEGKLKIQRCLQHVRIKKISEDRLREADPDLVSFFNINTPDDLIRAQQLIK